MRFIAENGGARAEGAPALIAGQVRALVSETTERLMFTKTGAGMNGNEDCYQFRIWNEFFDHVYTDGSHFDRAGHGVLAYCIGTKDEVEELVNLLRPTILDSLCKWVLEGAQSLSSMGMAVWVGTRLPVVHRQT